MRPEVKSSASPGKGMTRYESDWLMISDFIAELKEEQLKIVATRNSPNDLFDKVNWYVVDDLQEKMVRLRQSEN